MRRYRTGPPTATELQAAFRAGATVAMGYPTYVRGEDGATHLLNLAGPPGQYWTYRNHAGIVRIECGAHVSHFVDGRNTEWDGVTAMRAYEASPDEGDRHTPQAAKARVEAGQIAMGIGDSHVRASVLSALDAWEAIAEIADAVDDEPGHGQLYDIPKGDDAESSGRILIVTCPSTGRRYAHLVPQECGSAEAARRWMMGLGPGDPLPGTET